MARREALEQVAAILDFPTLRRDSTKRAVEYKFKNMEELVGFLSGEIDGAGMNYAKLARLSRVCPSTVSRLANHLTQSPRAATVFSILAALGYEVVVRK